MNFKNRPSSLAILAIAILSIFLAGQARADLQEGLVAYWPLDEIDTNASFGTITTPDYASSNIMVMVGGITLTPSGVPTTTLGIYTNAFQFPNSLSYFTTSGSPTPISGLPAFKSAGGYTISMWVKAATNTAVHYIYTEGSSSSANPLLLMQNGNAVANTNKLDILIRNDAATAQLNHVVSTSVVFDNTWHHIAWVDNHGTNALYVDGKLDATSFKYTPAGTYSMNVSTVGALVRNTVAANIFAGQIDNVAIWSRTLSQAEVQQFMSNSIPLPIVQSKPVLQSVSPNSTNSMGDFPPTFTLNVLGSNPISYQWYSNNIPLSDQTSNSLTLNSNVMIIPSTNTFTIIASNLLGTFATNITETVLPDPTNNLAAGLLSYWPLDEADPDPTTNTITPDIVGHNDFILGAATGGPPTIVSPGEFTNALAFDASQGQFAVDRRGLPNYLLTNYSVSMWVNGQPQPQLRVFSESSTNNGTPLFTISTETSGFLPYASILIRNDANAVLVNNLHGQLPAFDGNWHHIVWVDQNGYALLYVDGLLDPTPYAYARSGTFTLNTTSIGAIVRGSPGNFFTGSIDDVAIWNRRLTYSEIQELQTNTPPSPTSIMPATIFGTTFQPADLTNNLYVGDNFTLNVQATGTEPIYYQWYKDGQPVDTVANPTATNSSLVITNAQVSDSGLYSIVVSNGDPVLPGGGTASNIVATATVHAFFPATNGVALLVDVDALGTTNIQPGFVEYNTSLAGVGLTNGIRVTISGYNGAALADRLRTNIVNGGGLTQAQIYNDFIFANDTTNGTGLRILIEHLAPSTSYAVTIWSFDPVSAGNRVSDWTDLTSGTPELIETNYTFNGSVLPVADYQDTINALLTSSPSGTLLIQGVTDVNNTSFGTFVNGIKLVANPPPAPPTITRSGLAADGNLQITTAGPYVNQPINSISFVYSPVLPATSWLPVTNSILVTNSGNTAIAEIPISTNAAAFFRAIVQ